MEIRIKPKDNQIGYVELTDDSDTIRLQINGDVCLAISGGEIRIYEDDFKRFGLKIRVI